MPKPINACICERQNLPTTRSDEGRERERESDGEDWRRLERERVTMSR